MNIQYMGIDIPCKSITGLSFSEKIDSDNVGIVEVTLCDNPSNRIVTANMIGEIKISFKDYTFDNWTLVRDSASYSGNEIRLQIRHKISDILSQNMTRNITYNDTNPVTVVKEILDSVGINYNASQFQVAENWCNDIGETVDVCYYQLVDISIRDVLTEILGKICCILFVDYANDRLNLFNYANLPVGMTYNEIFRPYVMKKTESVGDEYYNSFKIGIYPDSYVMQQTRYKYKCSNTTYSNVWFDEDDITLEQTSGDDYAATLKYNKYDVTNSIIYEANSLWTCKMSERVAVTTNVSEKVQQLAAYSAETLYGTQDSPAWSVWEDENVYNESACCRHTNPDGAAAIGNQIIKRFYRKAKHLTLDMAKFMPFCNGEILTFENMNWILIEQKINDDMSADMELEELIDD